MIKFNRHQLCHLTACGVRGKYTKSEIVEILVFKRSARIFAFNTNGDDYKNKEIINALEV